MTACNGHYGSTVGSSLRLATDSRTLLVSKSELNRSKELVRDYQYGRIPEMNADLWKAKKSNLDLESKKLIDSC